MTGRFTGRIHNMRKCLGYDFFLASIHEGGRLALSSLRFDCVHEARTIDECAAWLRARGITDIVVEK